MGRGGAEHMTTMSNSNASCFRVGLSWVELRWVLTIKVFTFRCRAEVYYQTLNVQFLEQSGKYNVIFIANFQEN